MARDLEGHLRRQIERSRDFFWHRLRWRAVSSYLAGSEAFDLLDIGAGAGLLGLFLERDFPNARYRFIEPIRSLEEYLEKTHGADANAATKDRFDGVAYVTLLDVLEHQEDDRAFLEDLVSKMEKGSVLLMTVPALQSLWSGWDVALGHHRRYTPASLLDVLRGLPLEMAEVSYLFPELIPAALIRKRQLPAAETAIDESTAFPDLPDLANSSLHLIGRLTLAARHIWPVGTSVFAALRRT